MSLLALLAGSIPIAKSPIQADIQGWVVRWATYSDYLFEEGVSLTAADELSRWQKYAWGVSEIVFYPIKHWFRKGVFTPLFKGLISSTIPTHSKWGIMAYMFSYYGTSLYRYMRCETRGASGQQGIRSLIRVAFSSAWIGTIVSFVLVGVFVWADTFCESSWQPEHGAGWGLRCV